MSDIYPTIDRMLERSRRKSARNPLDANNCPRVRVSFFLSHQHSRVPRLSPPPLRLWQDLVRDSRLTTYRMPRRTCRTLPAPFNQTRLGTRLSHILPFPSSLPRLPRLSRSTRDRNQPRGSSVRSPTRGEGPSHRGALRKTCERSWERTDLRGSWPACDEVRRGW